MAIPYGVKLFPLTTLENLVPLYPPGMKKFNKDPVFEEIF